jgi:hypothetical protein
LEADRLDHEQVRRADALDLVAQERFHSGESIDC